MLSSSSITHAHYLAVILMLHRFQDVCVYFKNVYIEIQTSKKKKKRTCANGYHAVLFSLSKGYPSSSSSRGKV